MRNPRQQEPGGAPPETLALVRCENCGYVQSPGPPQGDTGGGETGGSWGLEGEMARRMRKVVRAQQRHGWEGSERLPAGAGQQWPAREWSAREWPARGGGPRGWGDGSGGDNEGESTRRFSGSGHEQAGWGRSGGRFAGRGPKGYRRSDARIREDVCDWLADDPWLDARDLEVEVAEGEVTLRGTVPDRASKRRSEALSAGVPGVKDVRNELRIAKERATTEP